jgi:hypothetical protein
MKSVLGGTADYEGRTVRCVMSNAIADMHACEAEPVVIKFDRSRDV